MNNVIIKKLKSTEAFSMAETLMAVLLLSIVFTAVGGGVVVMKDNYTKVVLRAEQQTLLSTVSSVVSADLASATKIKTDSGNVGVFYCNRRNLYMKYGKGSNLEAFGSSISFDNAGDGIYYGVFSGIDAAAANKTQALLSEATGILDSSKKTKLKTAISAIKATDKDGDGCVDYFSLTIYVAAKGGKVEEQEIVIKPYNSVPMS